MPEASRDRSLGTFGKNMKATRENTRIMRPTLILAGAIWVNSVILIALFAFAFFVYGLGAFSGPLAALPLTFGFSLFVAIRLTQRYRQGIPFNDERKRNR
jgi:hypothetical protein